jgi:mRNA-degrading endonuclease RelE of RelBE toxin-antitoxin system
MRRHRFTARFEKSFAKLPGETAELFEQKLPLFLGDMHHPSFRAKKVQGFKNPYIWEASLTMEYRFTFQMEKDGVIIFRNIGRHSMIERKKV